jgi:predicted nucleotidyltransferase
VEEWLKKIEADHHIEVLFACEAGSRAWGYDSPDSDQDIRYIYKYMDLRTYVSMDDPPDVIDHSFPFDSQGWDLKKAFRLLRKSNPSLLEWSYSPIVYRDRDGFAKKLREIIKYGYSPYSLGKHYLSLAKRNVKEAETNLNLVVQQKQLLYSLRSLIMIKGLSENREIPAQISPGLINLPSECISPELAAFLKLVNAKKNGRLLLPGEVEEVVELIHCLLNHSAEAVEGFDTGKDMTGMLNEWIWESLKV